MNNPKNNSAMAFLAFVWVIFLLLLANHVCHNIANDLSAWKIKTPDEMINAGP